MYASPEQARDGFADARADQYALAATVWELLTGQPPFEGATAAEVIKAKLDSPLAPVRLLRPDVPARLEEVLARASAIHPDDRFATIAEFVASWQSALAASLTTTTAPPEASTDGRSGERLGATALTMSGLVVNPFKGLRPFGEADAADFFGRDQIVGELHQLVNEQRFTAVVGPSGSGKSSLVLAGLVPELKRGGFLVCRFTPGADPFDAFSAALIDLATVDQARALSPDLLRREGGLVVAVDALAADDGLVIVIDQLEELWTTTDDDERTLFAASLADLHRASSCARVGRDSSCGLVRPTAARSVTRAVGRPGDVRNHTHGGERAAHGDQRARRPRRRSFRRRSRRPIGHRGSRPTGVPATVAVRPRRTLRPPFGRHDHHRGVRPDRRPVRLRRPSGRIAVRQLHVVGPVGGAPALRPPRDSRRRCRGHPPKGPSERVGRRRRPGRERVGRSTPPHHGSRPRVTRTHRRDRPRGTTARMAPTTRVARRGPRLGARTTRSGECHPPLGVERSRRRRSLSRRAARGDQRARARPHRFTDARRGRVPGRVGASRRCRADRRRGTDPHEGTTEPPSPPLARRSRRGHDLGADRRSGRSRSKQPRGRPSDRGTGPGSVGGGAIRRRGHTASGRRRAARDCRGPAHCGRGTARRGRGSRRRRRPPLARRDTAFVNLTNTSLLERGNRQDLAALLAIEAYRIDPERSRSALFSTFTRNVGFLGYRPLEDANAVLGVVPLADGTDALGALDGGRLVRFDIASGSTVQILDPIDSVDDPVDEATMLRLSGDGRIAVLAVQGGDALTWRAYDVTSGEPVAPPVTVPFAPSTDPTRPGLVAPFGDASLSADGALLAIAGGATGRVLVFATADGSMIGSADFQPPDRWSIPAHTASVLFDTDNTLWVGVPNGEVLTIDPTGAADGQLQRAHDIPRLEVEYGVRAAPRLVRRRWSVPDHVRERCRVPHRPPSRDDGVDEHEWFGEPARRTGWWNCRALGLVPCRDVVVSTASQHLYCADDFGSVFEQEVSTGARTPRLFDRQTGVTGPLALTVDQKELLASSYSDGAVALWKLDGSGPIQSVIASEDGSVATFGYNSTASLLNFVGGALRSVALGSGHGRDDRCHSTPCSSARGPMHPIASGLHSGARRLAAGLPVHGWSVRHHDEGAGSGRSHRFRRRCARRSVERHRTSTHVAARRQTTSGCSINSGTTSGRPSRSHEPGTGINTAQSSADGTKAGDQRQRPDVLV